MGVQRFSSAAPSARQRVMIQTVDPAVHTVEAILTDGTPISIVVWEQGTTFRWPIVGEMWTVYQEQNQWKLDKPVEGVQGAPISALTPGDTQIHAPTGTLSVASSQQSLTIDQNQTTGKVSITDGTNTTTTLNTASNLTLTTDANGNITITSPHATISYTTSGDLTATSGAHTISLTHAGLITLDSFILDLTTLGGSVLKAFVPLTVNTGDATATVTHNLNVQNATLMNVYYANQSPLTISSWTRLSANQIRITWGGTSGSFTNGDHLTAFVIG